MTTFFMRDNAKLYFLNEKIIYKVKKINITIIE